MMPAADGIFPAIDDEHPEPHENVSADFDALINYPGIDSDQLVMDEIDPHIEKQKTSSADGTPYAMKLASSQGCEPASSDDA